MLTLDGDQLRAARVGEPMTLAIAATDDGIPKRTSLPRLSATGEAPFPTLNIAYGLRVAWFVYRGEGTVTFDPPQIKTYVDPRGNSPWAPGWGPPPIPPDGKWVVHATFSQPGTYVLRSQAHDGGLATEKDVTVVVTK